MPSRRMLRLGSCCWTRAPAPRCARKQELYSVFATMLGACLDCSFVAVGALHRDMPRKWFIAPVLISHSQCALMSAAHHTQGVHTVASALRHCCCRVRCGRGLQRSSASSGPPLQRIRNNSMMETRQKMPQLLHRQHSQMTTPCPRATNHLTAAAAPAQVGLSNGLPWHALQRRAHSVCDGAAKPCQEHAACWHPCSTHSAAERQGV